MLEIIFIFLFLFANSKISEDIYVLDLPVNETLFSHERNDKNASVLDLKQSVSKICAEDLNHTEHNKLISFAIKRPLNGYLHNQYK